MPHVGPREAGGPRVQQREAVALRVFNALRQQRQGGTCSRAPPPRPSPPEERRTRAHGLEEVLEEVRRGARAPTEMGVGEGRRELPRRRLARRQAQRLHAQRGVRQRPDAPPAEVHRPDEAQARARRRSREHGAEQPPPERSYRCCSCFFMHDERLLGLLSPRAAPSVCAAAPPPRSKGSKKAKEKRERRGGQAPSRARTARGPRGSSSAR